MPVRESRIAERHSVHVEAIQLSPYAYYFIINSLQGCLKHFGLADHAIKGRLGPKPDP